MPHRLLCCTACNAAPPEMPHRLQCRTAYIAAPPATPHCLLYRKWPTGSGNMSNLRLSNSSINFCLTSFLIRSCLLWEPQKSKMAARGFQNGRHHLERCLPLDFLALLSTFLKRFFESSTPSMRKGHDGEKKLTTENMMFIVATNVIAN